MYRSPSISRIARNLENRLLASDDSCCNGRTPFYVRMVAEVPRALYLNFLIDKAHVSSFSPTLFKPLDFPAYPNATLFTILHLPWNALIVYGRRVLPVPSPREFGNPIGGSTGTLRLRVQSQNLKFCSFAS